MTLVAAEDFMLLPFRCSRLIKAPCRSSAARRGFSMIEALVALLIFSFGILGLVGLQATMTQAQTAAKFRGDAAYLASEVIGSMWADFSNRASYNTGGDCEEYARCTAWLAKVADLLPSGTATIAVGLNNTVDVTIQWVESDQSRRTYTTSTSVRSQSGE
jgi:type IV pilus assembly protein PilV